jgi:hypothetical protein
MRAKEFTINVPITITINGDDDPVVNAANTDTGSELQQNPVMVPPLQQTIELNKAEHGKESPVIDKLIQDQDLGKEPAQEEEDPLERIKQLLSAAIR